MNLIAQAIKHQKELSQSPPASSIAESPMADMFSVLSPDEQATKSVVRIEEDTKPQVK